MIYCGSLLGEDMRSVTVQFDMTECAVRAEELFLHEAGITGEGEKYERMHRAAFAIRKEIEDKVQLKGRYCFYENFRLRGQKLTIFTPRDDSSPDCPSQDCPNEADVAVTLECTAFEQLEPASIEGVYAYALTAGDFYLEDRPVMDQLYADIWGTAFTDAGREALVDLIREDCRRRDGGDVSEVEVSDTEVSEAVVSNADISDSFGPGFYGMSPAEMRKMPLLVDFHKLGLTVNETGVMQPLKSCGGILLKVNGLYKHLNSACETCSGSRKTCRLCNV